MDSIVFDNEKALELLLDKGRPKTLLGLGSGGVRSLKERARCLELFDKHMGAAGHSRLRDQLELCLNILTHCLALPSSITLYCEIIKTDWRCHMDLVKSKRYRDHILHPLCVTAVGSFLLEENGRDLLEKLASHYALSCDAYCSAHKLDIQGEQWTEVVEMSWLLCGLLHDIGYSLEYDFKYGIRSSEVFDANLLKVLYPAFQYLNATMESFNGTWFEEAGGCEMLNKRLTNFEAEHSHAPLGALQLLLGSKEDRLWKALDKNIHSEPGLVVQLAARAILTHHDEKPESFDDPLALLLHVADTLHLWERPFCKTEPGSGKNISHQVRKITECRSVHLESNGSGYRVRFTMNDDDDDMNIIKNNFAWKVEEFVKPFANLQELTAARPWMPEIRLFDPLEDLLHFIGPEKFRQVMGIASNN